MKTIATNPYLPSWEYVPDGEPHVFGDRVYLYGSHDLFGGHVFCLGDYVCWSAPVEDPGDWRYEGVIYQKTDDPLNRDGAMCLYAPDVTRGPDGQYYLYYVLDKVSVVSVAVSDQPAGPYRFYGYVRHSDGTRLGEGPQDEPQFDPAVLTEGEITYLYTGFCARGDQGRHGAMATVLGPDMLTVREAPRFVLPSEPYSAGTGFEGHEFFEAPSIRRVGNLYHLVYSSVAMHELCHATSTHPTGGFTYRGLVVSNADVGVGGYKPTDLPMAAGANNHGGLVALGPQWYIFYHRHTNGTWFSRQGCAEPVTIAPDGHIEAVPMSSCGLNGGPLPGKGTWGAWLACHLYTPEHRLYVESEDAPKIRQDGRDGDPEAGYISHMGPGATAGFRSFIIEGMSRFEIHTRGYGKGHFEVRNRWDGPVLGTIPVNFTNVWTRSGIDLTLDDGVHDIYLTFAGSGKISLQSFTIA